MSAAHRATPRHTGIAQRGFTLVELITVVVLVGAMAAVAAPRFADPGPFRVRAFFDDTVAATRYAQKLAIASGCNVRIAFNAGYSAFMSCNSAAESAVPRPGSADALTGAAPGGVTVTTTSVTFDKIGRAVAITAGNVVSVDSFSFTVDAETGLVQ